MPFTDKYPEQIEFEIDRPRLIRYWRLCGFLGCCIPCVVGVVLIALPLLGDYLQTHRHLHLGEILVIGLAYLAVGAIAGLLIGLLLYIAMSHYSAKWAAQNLRLIIEGPYLRLISGGLLITDRRIHFRAISDYSTTQGPMLRLFGMKTLSFRVVGSSQSFSTTVAGLKEPDKVRDALCEIDAAREN